MLKRLKHEAQDAGLVENDVLRRDIVESPGRLGNLSERERVAMLRTFDEVVPRIPEGSAAAVDRELAELRRARKAGRRRTPAT